MGISNFFKKLFMEEKAEEIAPEKLAFSDIEGWAEKKEKENEFKEKEILDIISEKIERFTKELREKIIILESVDIKSRREKDHIKEIVESSRKNYINSIGDFLEDLNDLEINSLDVMKKINKIFLDFNKGSYKNYERTTILIGKEMGSMKEILGVFSRELIKTFDDGNEIRENFKRIFSIKSKLDTIIRNDKTLEKISETILLFWENINSKEEENKTLLEDIEEVKMGSRYLENLRNREKIKSLNEELKSDIFSLKQVIDFKALANFFHINEDQMKILKEHREDFHTNFQKDNGKVIIDFLEESKLNNKAILERVNLIRTKIEEVENYERKIKEDETLEIGSQIKTVFLEIDNFKIEKIKEEKRGKKLKESKVELVDSLKKDLGEMNVEVI
jgi:hypothetical protein